MKTKSNWIILFILFPMLPIILRALIKLIMGHISFEIVNSAELLFILALMALLISQELKLARVPLDNKDKKKERYERSLTFFLCFIFLIIFGSISEILNILVTNDILNDYSNSFLCCNFLSYIFAIILLKLSFHTRKQFNLTAKFI